MLVAAAKIDAGDTAWVLASAALVLFMTPGLAFFYGGMVRGKNVLGMLMQNVFCMGLVSVLWAFVAFSLAFGKDHGGVIGGFDLVGLKGLFSGKIPGLEALTIPALAFVALYRIRSACARSAAACFSAFVRSRRRRRSSASRCATYASQPTL